MDDNSADLQPAMCGMKLRLTLAGNHVPESILGQACSFQGLSHDAPPVEAREAGIHKLGVAVHSAQALPHHILRSQAGPFDLRHKPAAVQQLACPCVQSRCRSRRRCCQES